MMPPRRPGSRRPGLRVAGLPSGRPALRRIVLAFGLSFIVALVAAIGYEVWRERDRAHHDARRAAEHLARTLEQHAARTLEAVDLSLRMVVLTYQSQLARGALDEAALHQLMLRRAEESEPIRALLVLNADGKSVVDSAALPARPLDAGDRLYFRVHYEHPRLGLFIGPPVRSRITGQWAISVSRRVEASDGSFAGAVVAALDPAHLERFYGEAVGEARRAQIVMANADRVVLVQYPHDDERVGLPLTIAVPDAGAPGRPARAIDPSGADEAPRQYAHAWIGKLGLVMVVGYSPDDLWPGPVAMLLRFAPIFGVAVIIVVLLLAVAMRELDRGERTERELAERSQSLQVILNNLDEGIALFEADGRLIARNEDFLRLWSLPVEVGAIGQTAEAIWRYLAERGEYGPVDVDDAVADGWSRRLTALPHGYSITRPNGQTIAIRGQPLPGGGFLRIYSDATAQRRAQARIKEQARVAEFMRDLAQVTGETARLDDAAKSCLERLCRHLGWPLGHVLIRSKDGTSFSASEIWYMTDPMRYETLHEAWISLSRPANAGITGEVVSSRRRYWSDDVTRDPIFSQAHVARANGLKSGLWIPVVAEGRVMMMLVLFAGRQVAHSDAIDMLADRVGEQMSRVAERIHAARQIADRETRIRAVLDNVLDGVIAINPSGTIETFNPAAAAIFGYAAEEVIGRNVAVLMPEPHGSQHDAYLHRYLTSGQPHIIGQGARRVEGRRKDGSTFPLELGVSELRLGDQRLYVGVVRDISERLAVERMKTEFVSVVSHELRTPLTSIAGSLDLIAGGATGELPAKARRLVEIAASNADRLVRLINDILDIEKIESGKMRFDAKPVRVTSLVADALAENRAYGERYGVELVADQRSADALVLGDADRLMQVLGNLMSNAVKYSPRGGRVWITAVCEAGRVRIAVADKGAGIPEEFRARIFGKFAQADSSDARRREGTGLGLSIVKLIVERHGGSVDFQSEPGQGTAFYVELPELRQTIPVEPDAPIDETVIEGAAILHVEDDPDVASLVRIAIGAGATLTSVGSVVEARRALALRDYDLIVLDLDLGGESSEPLLAELVDSVGRQIPAIVFSAHEAPVAVVARSAGVLVKSRTSMPQLRAAISRALAGRGKAAEAERVSAP